jgi:hypothetical protein
MIGVVAEKRWWLRKKVHNRHGRLDPASKKLKLMSSGFLKKDRKKGKITFHDFIS